MLYGSIVGFLAGNLDYSDFISNFVSKINCNISVLYGYGEIDAYKGLLYVLELDKTGIISTENPHSARISLKGNSLFVHLERPAPFPAQLSVYSLTGQKVHEARLAAGESTCSVPLPALASGVYAVQLNTGCPDTTGSSLIRIR